jgi:PAS domain S-box-containing protein
MQHQPARLFVVDDNPDIRFATARLMRSAGYEVTELGSGEECLQQAREKHPDLILMDVIMPGLNGLEVCRQIKSDPDLADIYVVLLSGSRVSSPDQAEGLEVGADNYIARPVSNRELLARVQATLRLKQMEAKRLRLALEAGQLGTWDYNLMTNMVSLDQRMCQLFGISSANSLVNVADVYSRMHPDDVSETQGLIQALLDQGGEFRQEFRVLHPGEKVCWLISVGRLFRDESDQPLMIGVTFDITDRKQAETEREQLLSQLQVEQAQLQRLTETLEEQVAHRTEQVNALAAALSLAEEQERKRLAQTLHDDLQQALYSQLLKLKILRDKHGSEERAGLYQEANDVIQGLEEAINITRSLAVELSPPGLKEAPFSEVLQWLVGHMEKEHYIKVQLSIQGQCHINNRNIQTLLLQMIRELLFNIVKHAGTNQGRIHVWQEDQLITIRIEDDGKGFDVKAVQVREKQRGRFGFASVEERLALIGGRLEVVSEPGRGTQITLVAPVA